MQESSDQVIKRWVQVLKRRLNKVVPNQPNETEFREAINPLLVQYCQEAGASSISHAEYTLASGRADAVFHQFVIEYKRPGVLSDRLFHSATVGAVEQLKGYLLDIGRKERIDRLAGVVFDGQYIVFVRYRKGDSTSEPPVAANPESLERLLHWLASLSSGKALTAENLNRDFSIDQPRTQNALNALTSGLVQDLKSHPDGMVGKLFAQWRLFFSESIDYSEAFGGRKLDSLSKWSSRAGIKVNSGDDAEHFFYALHTYFALLLKLLAWLALSKHIAVKLGVPGFGELVSADSETVRSKLHEMESGGIFRSFGIENLLEGDFFTWYLYAWNNSIESSVRDLLKQLDEYDPATLSIEPQETRDLFKQLYHYLLPREIRHNLGEYYTPDWLALRLLTQIDNEFMAGDPKRNASTLRNRLQSLRWLDPSCGSGTFLILLIARMRQLGDELLINEADLLNGILNNVVGIDLNPLAVLTARVNYLMAVADLLPRRKRTITLPVYLADSVRTPTTGADIFASGAYEFPTAVGKFRVPETLCKESCFNRFTQILEESIRSEITADAFITRTKKEIGLSSESWNEASDAGILKELYDKMLELHRQGMNGLWARLLRNNFAPLTLGQFDYVAGNPPWVNWENLPDGYREELKPLWVRYGLFPHGGMDTILGKGKKDISMLMTYTVIDNLLKDVGRLGFIITQSVLKTSGAGQGFRKFVIPQGNGGSIPLKVLHVDDMVELQPFEGASNRTAVIILEKGKPNEYPVPYTVWRKERGSRFTYESTLEEVAAATERPIYAAQPVSSSDPTSSWLTARQEALRAIKKVLGRSDYTAHAGAFTGGANGVYWVDVVEKRPGGLVIIQNLTEGAKIKVDKVTAPIEPDLLYPLLRGRDVQRWRAEPSALILMAQDPVKRRGYDEREMQTRYPYTYGYLKRFEEVLKKRAAFIRYFTRKDKQGRSYETGPFYSMFDIGDYTFADWKVVWPNIAKSLEASVISQSESKVIIPQHIITLIACKSEEEAHYLCALVNSQCANLAARAYSQEGGKSFGDPHILENIRIPKYDPTNPTHLKLADLSNQAHSAAAQADDKQLREIEEEIDRLAAQLWGLSEQEFREIQASLLERQ